MTNDRNWKPIIVAIIIAGIIISTLVIGFVILSFYTGFIAHSTTRATYLDLTVVDSNCTEEGAYLNITQRDLTDYPTLKTGIDEIFQTNKTNVHLRIQDEERQRIESELGLEDNDIIVYKQYCFEIRFYLVVPFQNSY